MGEVVGCGLIAHVPTIMLPEKIRHELNEGKDFSLVEGLHRLKRDVLEKLDYDTVLAGNLKVMDAAAVALCRDNAIPIVVFSIREQGNLAKVLAGQGTQTTVQKGA